MPTADIEMKQMTCGECHMVFWMPKSFHDQCWEQRPHKGWYCPAGHSRVFLGESDLEKERRLRQRVQQENARLAEEAAAAEAHLATLPKTRMVEVWHSEWVNRPPGSYPDELHVAVWPSREDAERDAENLRTNPRNEGQWVCIRVTGPHSHEVPA